MFFFFFLTLFTTAADLPGALGTSCVLHARFRLPGDRPTALVGLVPSHREHKAAGRSQAPLAAPAPSLLLSTRPRAGALYTPPALVHRAPAATPSSQRDPPLPPA